MVKTVCLSNKNKSRSNEAISFCVDRQVHQIRIHFFSANNVRKILNHHLYFSKRYYWPWSDRLLEERGTDLPKTYNSIIIIIIYNKIKRKKQNNSDNLQQAKEIVCQTFYLFIFISVKDIVYNTHICIK